MSRRELWGIVTELKSQSRTVVLTTHYMEEAERLCDRVAVIDRGHIIAMGTPVELIGQLGATQIVELSTINAVTRERLAAVPGVRSVSSVGDRWRLAVDSVADVMPPLLDALRTDDVALSTLATRGASLEDVFVALTGRTIEGTNGGGAS